MFTLEAEYCPLCQGLAAQTRELEHLDKQARARVGDDFRRRLPSDGRTTYIRQLTESEITERREAAEAARKEASRGNS